MFCDLVGSTTLFAELDPEDVSELVRSYTRCCADQIQAAGGFVAQFQGDGVLGYFGYVRASESDAERAVRAALELVELVPKIQSPRGRRLQVRIGISTGLTVVGDPLGEGTRLEQGAVGETLHLAARLQTFASSNEIVIGDSTKRLIGKLFFCRNLGRLALKGFGQPVQAWRVLGARPLTNQFRVRRDPLLTRIVGRDAEIGILSRAWQAAIGSQGQLVSLVGEAGIGKSRLITEFRHRISREEHIWLEGAGAQFYGNTPLHAVAQMIQRLLDPAGRASSLEFRSRLERALDWSGMRGSEASSLIVEMLDLPSSEPLSTSSVVPSERRTRLYSTLIDWLQRSAHRQPLVIVLEDLHWVDPSSLELVGEILENVKTLRVLMLHSMRPEFRPSWPAPAYSTRVKLNRLSDDDVRQIITRISTTAGSMTNEDLAQVVERAEGVPLFGIELARLVNEQKAQSGDRKIPATLSDLLTARLDHLGPAKTVAQVAAVIGDEISFRLLEEVSEIPASRLRSRLAMLKKNGVLHEKGRYPDLSYVFTHSLLRDAAYDALLKVRRRQLHRRAAVALGERFATIAGPRPELVAYHWTNAGELELAIVEWQKAGDLSGSRRAFSEAEQAYQNAVSALMNLPLSSARDATELTLQSCLADVLRITRGFSAHQTIETTARAHALAEKKGDQTQQLLQMWGAWTAASSGGNYVTARNLADQYHRLALADGGFDSRAHAHMIQMTSRYRVGDLIGAEDYFERGRQYFEFPDFQRRPGVIAQTYGNAAQIAWILGNEATAKRRIEYALMIARQNDNPYDLTYAQYMAAMYSVLLNQLELAVDFAKNSISLSDKYGFPQFAGISWVVLGRARAGLGFAEEGAKLIREGLVGMAAASSRVAITLYITWLAEAHVFAKSFEAALVEVENALQTNPQELFYRPESLRLRGEILKCGGMFDEAEQDLVEALALANRMGAKHFSELALRSLQQLLQSRGNGTDTIRSLRDHTDNTISSPVHSP
jgi:class 3 adenylate cyclase/tetratricopeptide (TPR) repeat protein